jgi:hypothetical protein
LQDAELLKTGSMAGGYGKPETVSDEYREEAVQRVTEHGSVFIMACRHVKNADNRLVVLNRIVASVVEARRGNMKPGILLPGQSSRTDAELRMHTGKRAGGPERGPGP